MDLLHKTDLYVHTSDAEIEAISCIEAIACGNVPIISNSNKSATPQFALDERSLFEAGNSDDLARKIDNWLDNKQELDKCILVCSNCHRELHNPQQTKDNLLELIDLSEQQKELKKLQKGSICPICNTKFKKVTGKKYCSKECRNKA